MIIKEEAGDVEKEDSSSLSSSDDEDRSETAKPKVKNLTHESSTEYEEFSDNDGIKHRFKPTNRFSFYPSNKEKCEEAEPLNKPKYEDDITFSKLQLALMLFLVLAMVYVVYEHEYMHLCALRFYANLGHSDAQHILAQRYYLGRGVPRNKSIAFYWFKEAAKQGHAHASYNLGVAHLQV